MVDPNTPRVDDLLKTIASGTRPAMSSTSSTIDPLSLHGCVADNCKLDLIPDSPLAFDLDYIRERSKSIDSDQSIMSGYYYTTEQEQNEIEPRVNQPVDHPTSHAPQPFSSYPAPIAATLPVQQAYYDDLSHLYLNQTSPFTPLPWQSQAWATPTVPTHYSYPNVDEASFPQFDDTLNYPSSEVALEATALRQQTGYLSPELASRNRNSRSTSLVSTASSVTSQPSAPSRSTSPSGAEMLKWGAHNADGSWSCAYPGCTSRSRFTRGCDLRKHYKRHSKTLFCRWAGCPQATDGGFSSKKDRLRHEAKHNPTIRCEWEGCDRKFSRQDNMKDHVRRMHQRRES